MNILLLNPPGSQNYLRDYYCTSITKTRYYYHPVDLLYLSGTLAREHRVSVLDAVPRRMGPEACLEEIRRRRPDAVVALVSAPSFAEDHAFLSKLKAAVPAARLIATGDVYREYREEVFARQPYLEATLVDFSTDDLLVYLRGPGGRPVDNVIYRQDGALVAGPERHGKGEFRVPLPLWDEFPPGLYSMPFVRRTPVATVLSDFGCPYHCTFCPVSTLSFKLRPVEDVVEEIRLLWGKGYRELLFRDQTFAVNKRRTLELCARLASEFPGLAWSCLSRVDVMDEERAAAMAKAGCHTVIFGIEFDEDLLQSVMRKNIDKGQIVSALELCRRHGLRSAGTFIVGLPDQDAASFLRTGELAVRLDLDYASFNLAMPRMGTPWRKELVAQGKVDADALEADTQRGADWKESKLERRQAQDLLRAVERRFYLRPAYLARMLAQTRSWAELKAMAKNGLGLLVKDLG